MTLKYFSHKELQCPETSIVHLADGFGEKLDELREAWGKAIIVNSCCRSASYNAKVGGAANSFHIWNREGGKGVKGTCAVDVHVVHAAERWQLAHLAMSLGWSVGVAKTFLHLDRRADYAESGWPETVLFTY